MRTRCILALLCALPLSLFGQAGLGTINGSVVDHSGAVIAGAHVKLVELSTKSTRQILSNQQGLFSLPSLVPGQYTLTLSNPGFKEENLENIVINGFQELNVGAVVLQVEADRRNRSR